MSDDPSFAVSFTARVDAARGAIAPGSPLVYDAAAGDWVLSTAANRATANARTQAFALTYEGNSIIGTVSYQQAGVLSQSLSGLAAGAQQLVRVTSAGGIERVANYTAGDDVVGIAEPDGRVHLLLGFPIDSIIALIAAGAVTFGGDLTGNGTSQTVVKLQGVAISGTPSAGTALVATDATHASWATSYGWRTAIDLDFRIQSNQTFATDGTYTIAGLTWTKRNSASDRLPMANVAGTGLVIQPIASTQWGATNGNGFTLPVLDLDLFGLSNGIAFGRPLRVTAYVSASNENVNYDRACIGIFSATNASTSTFAYVAERGVEGGTAQCIGRIISEGTDYEVANAMRNGATNAVIPHGTANDVLRLYIPELGMSREQVLTAPHGAGASEIPADSAFTTILEKSAPGLVFFGINQMCLTNTRVGLGAARIGSATNLSITFARLVVEYLA